MTRPPKMRYCKKCVYPMSSAVPLTLDDDGVCSGCKTAAQRVDIDWDYRLDRLKRILEKYKNPSGYDCIIPVSGGKDSYFQIHTIKKLGYNPLLVTYNANNYTDVGMLNLIKMREVFGCDHVFMTPAVRTLKALNRLGMMIMGDMNWHCHAGIFTYPIREAVEKKIPLMIWGEQGFSDLGGMHSYNDFVEFTYRHRHEHGLRGYEWNNIMGKAAEYGEFIKEGEMNPWKYPSDDEISAVGVRGIYLSNFVCWDANMHGPLMQELYGWEPSPEPFDRTYRTMSNLDDMHENGVHDLMKFVKFGYGRCTDHCCKDIRAGIMTREEAVLRVRGMDSVIPKDLQRWLTYVGWDSTTFWNIANTFRDSRVWWKENGQWRKDNVWDS